MSTSTEKKSSLLVAAGRVSSATAVSRVLGLVREQVMAYFFGASMATDVFVTAFRIPNLLRDLFAEGALSSAFVPIFKERLVKGTDEEAFDLARIVFTALLVVVGLIVLLGIVASPLIIYISANGFTENAVKFDLTVSLTRVMMPFLLLVSLAALVMGMLNSFGRFGVPAIAPAFFNLGIIVCTFGLYHYLEMPVYAMAIGVLVGGLGQLFIQWPQLRKVGFRFRFRFNFLDENVKRVLRLFGPMVAGLSASRVNILVSTLVASYLVEGSISYLNYSYRLMHFPLGVFAVALGTVTLPNASELAARRDLRSLGDAFHKALNLNMFLIIPSAFYLALLGYDLVSLVYQWGAFGETAAHNTAFTLFHYSYGLIGFAAVRVTAPIYYALNDSKTPMWTSMASVALNIALYYPLVKILDFAGLAAATSIAGLVNFGLLLYLLPRKDVPVDFPAVFLNVFRMVVAAGLAAFLAEHLPQFFGGDLTEGMRRTLTLATKTLAVGVLYFVFCYVLRVREVSILVKRTILRRPG